MMTDDEDKEIGEGPRDYSYNVLYPFTFYIRNVPDGLHRYIAACAQVPGFILEVDSLEELKAEAIRLFDGWFQARIIDEKKRLDSKMKNIDPQAGMIDNYEKFTTGDNQ